MSAVITVGAAGAEEAGAEDAGADESAADDGIDDAATDAGVDDAATDAGAEDSAADAGADDAATDAGVELAATEELDFLLPPLSLPPQAVRDAANTKIKGIFLSIGKLLDSKPLGVIATYL